VDLSRFADATAAIDPDAVLDRNARLKGVEVRGRVSLP
jgi:hypothetical protein